MGKSFIGDLATAFGLALLLNYAHGGDFMRAAKIGAVAGLFIAGGAVWINYNWHSKSIALWLIDASYFTVSAAIAAGIIGVM
jgi:hypothetical protein